MITGLCGGIGDYFNIDPTLVRITFVAIELLTAGIFFIAYFIVVIIVPRKPINS